MMKQSMRAAMAAAILTGIAGSVSAQSIDSPYRFLEHSQSVGVLGGYAWLSDGPLDLGPAAAPFVSINWALRLSGPFSIGAEVMYMPSTRSVRDTVIQADSTFRPIGTADVQLLGAMGNLRLNIIGPRTWHGLHPYVYVGAGITVDAAGSSDVDAELPPAARLDLGTSFAGQAGAGIEWFPSQRFAVRADARNMVWKLEVPQAFLATPFAAGREVAGSEWQNNFAISAGLSIYF